MFEVTVAQFVGEFAHDEIQYAILVYLDRKQGKVVKFQTKKKSIEDEDSLQTHHQHRHHHHHYRTRRGLQWKARELLNAQQRRLFFRGEVSVGFLPRGDEYLDSMEDCLWELEAVKGSSKWTSLQWIVEGLEKVERSGLAIHACEEGKLLQRLKQVWTEPEDRLKNPNGRYLVRSDYA
ncbi:hypothetical protein FRC17_009037 [Serendipita sp. 399]|nr:hypothetical protein FRC17_009037 [Serendipita sp. 399]